MIILNVPQRCLLHRKPDSMFPPCGSSVFSFKNTDVLLRVLGTVVTPMAAQSFSTIRFQSSSVQTVSQWLMSMEMREIWTETHRGECCTKAEAETGLMY